MTLLELLENAEEVREVKRIHGVAIGLVTSTRDPEGLGRVKVKLPWLSDETETDWVRLASPYAGAERGVQFLPEVDDEVVLAFEHGDVNFPVVIGAVWNTEQKPPDANPAGKNNVKVIRSRSGHEISFNDDEETGAEKIEVRSGAGHVVTLSDEAGREHLVVRDKTGNNLIKLDSVQNSIVVKASLEISLEAPAIKIKGDVVEIDASASMQLKAHGMLTLQGAIVKIN